MHLLSRRNATHTSMRTGSTRLLVLALIALLLPLPAPLAQSAAMNAQVNAPLTLHITILEGDNALNNIRQRTAREPIVQVEDANHKPVAGVAILFTSIRGPNGAGGTFNSLTSYKTVTNAEGKAVGRGFQPNAVNGQFTITVQATLASAMAGVIIHEENILGNGGAGGGSSTQLPAGTTTSGSRVVRFFNLIPKWAIVGVVVGGAAIGATVATRNSSGAVISAGGGTVNAPASAQAPARR